MKNVLSKFVILLLILHHSFGNDAKKPPSSDPPSCTLIDQMKTALLELFTPQGGEIQHGALRLAFHACVGGCNGCLNLKQADNNGLGDIVDNLETLYQNLGLAEQGVSRADFWSLAGTVAVEIGVQLANRSPIRKPCFEYLWGRTDCPTAPSQDIILEFPGGWMTSPQMFSYFQRTFNFAKAETVIIMGSHTIGMANRKESGFDGYWTPGEESVFNTTYYEAMIDPTLKWTNENAGFRFGRQHWQWQAVDPENGKIFMMFNTDFEVFFDLLLDSDGKAVCILDNTCAAKETCGTNGICPIAETYDQALTYAHSNNAFYEDFPPVYTKMISTGYNNLVSQGGTCQSCAK